MATSQPYAPDGLATRWWTRSLVPEPLCRAGPSAEQPARGVNGEKLSSHEVAERDAGLAALDSGTGRLWGPPGEALEDGFCGKLPTKRQAGSCFTRGRLEAHELYVIEKSLLPQKTTWQIN